MYLVRWSFILFQVFWLNIFIPGHIRGAITVNGSEDDCCLPKQVQVVADSCCAPVDKPVKGDQPTQDQKNRCAICYMVKGYSFPVIFTFDLEFTGNSHQRFAEYVSQIQETEFSFPYFPAGPPAADYFA